ncbi:MAG: alpha/beta fold hydrolase [Steroidobacteraceae bacterium]
MGARWVGIAAALSLGMGMVGCVSNGASTTSAGNAPQWLEANKVSLRYQLTGTGKTIVLMHEMQMSMESWDDVLPALQPGHRILRYDLRGFGMSEKIRGNLTIDDEVADLLGLLDTLKITEPVTLIGGAVGGAIALKFASVYPARVKAVAVTSPAAYMNAQPERLTNIDATANNAVRNGIDTAMNAVYPESLRTPAGVAKFRALVLANDPGSLAATTKMIYSTGFKDILPKVQCPALVVATALFPRSVESFKELSDAMPKGQFVVLQTGHFASLESPAMVAPVLTKFLKDVGG